jgi:hypothetical protein
MHAVSTALTVVPDCILPAAVFQVGPLSFQNPYPRAVEVKNLSGPRVLPSLRAAFPRTAELRSAPARVQ